MNGIFHFTLIFEKKRMIFSSQERWYDSYTEMSNVGKKKSKKSSLRMLHGALKELLRDNNTVVPDGEVTPLRENQVEERVTKHPASKQRCEEGSSSNDPVTQHDGVTFIMSKENQLIPKLTEEEVIERHRKADENMKQVWSKIIQKYENIEDQGDLIDLRTGEIVEDNGHLRGLSATTMNTTKYVSVLNDLIEIEQAESSIWNDEQDEEDSDSHVFREGITESGEDEYVGKNEQSS